MSCMCYPCVFQSIYKFCKSVVVQLLLLLLSSLSLKLYIRYLELLQFYYILNASFMGDFGNQWLLVGIAANVSN